VKWLQSIAELWSTTGFRAREVAGYAERVMVGETRSGVRAMSLAFLVPLLASVLVAERVGLGKPHVYTCAALAALAIHVYVSARAIDEIRSLQLLGMTLVIITGTAFVLLAHRTGAFGTALFGSVVLLFMVIPMVPWGLREASIVTLLVYGLFSSSTWSVADRFDAKTLFTLQVFMLAAGTVSLTLVARGARVRKEDIAARYHLETAHREVELRSLQDPLTGAWNRRYLELEFPAYAERARKDGETFHFALLDLDGFKKLNDTRGHAYGDKALRWVTTAFRSAVGDDGLVARTGGDEFALVLGGDDPDLRIAHAATSMREAALAKGEPGAPELSVSVGMLTLPRGLSVSLDEAYKAADNGLYAAKRARGEDSSALRLVHVTLE
jgi:diguanylate cyclase (GGDEF)-like protein